MRVRSLPVVLLVIASGLVVSGLSPGTGAAGHETFVVEGSEFPDSCSPPVLICYSVVSGDPDSDMHEGETITVTLRPVGNAPHNINVIEEANSDPNHLDTDVGQAIASSSTADSGLETSFQFTAPAEGTVLYFWCDIVEHEILGMWFTATVSAPLPAVEEPVANNTTEGPTTQNETAPADGNATIDANDTGDAPTVDDNMTRDDNATVTKSDEGSAVDEDAPGVSVMLALVAAAGVVWRARKPRA